MSSGRRDGRTGMSRTLTHTGSAFKAFAGSEAAKLEITCDEITDDLPQYEELR